MNKNEENNDNFQCQRPAETLYGFYMHCRFDVFLYFPSVFTLSANVIASPSPTPLSTCAKAAEA